MPDTNEVNKGIIPEVTKKVFADEMFLFCEYTSKKSLGAPIYDSLHLIPDYLITTPSTEKTLIRIPVSSFSTGQNSIVFRFASGYTDTVSFELFTAYKRGSSYKSKTVNFTLPANALFSDSLRLFIFNESEGVRIIPDAYVMRHDAEFSLPNDGVNPDKACLVRLWSGNQYYVGRIDSEQGRTGGKARTFGHFAIREDNKPPSLSFTNTTATSIKWKVSDDLSGFDCKNLPELYIDDVWCLNEYDPEKGECHAILPKTPRKGLKKNFGKMSGQSRE
jgi:hypothetical protein